MPCAVLESGDTRNKMMSPVPRSFHACWLEEKINIPSEHVRSGAADAVRNQVKGADRD